MKNTRCRRCKVLAAFMSTLLALGTTLSISACAPPSAQTDEFDPQNTIVYGSSDYTAINPALYEHGEINSLLFIGLTTHDALNKVAPGLATDWQWDENALTYTFKLRDGLKFHDGEPLTSADVKFTFEAILDESNGSENISNYTDIIGIDTPDELTVVFKLGAPNAALPDYMTMGILPKHLLEGKDITTDEFNQNPVGAGPYKLVSWDFGQSIVMQKFDDFCLGTPKVENIIFKIVPSMSTRALQLKTGELDMAQLSPKDTQQLNTLNGYTTYDMRTSDYRGILYNFNNPLWSNNPGLPAALSYAIDREAITSSVLLGKGEAAYSPLQRSPYNNADVEKYGYDPERAKLEIEALGWSMASDGIYQKDGQRLSFTITVPQNDKVRAEMADICAANLNSIGVEASVEILAKIDWQGQECYLIGWGSPFDPDDHCYKVFVSGQGTNYGSYSNTRVDELLNAARAETDHTKRTDLYREFQFALADDPAFTYLAYIDAVYVADSQINGINPNVVLGHHGVGIFWNVWEWSRQ